ncbi:hypothetical protein [cf. Phormidesmis sp. LEGE 11477]|uniref:hypothetical protein n=1 Tax=cf. Phormidesmis sp. LEGE 11477 TaxID=1828680 RepID=UPI00187E807D|nr:hypothetical protein [cf. Phormidesmis sp. LEGE 11477]
MSHSFLLEPGRWKLQGTWLTRDTLPVSIKGKILVAWKQADCFMVATKISFLEPDILEEPPADIVIQSRGRMTAQNRQYTFVLQHSELGQTEGEGWIAPESIVQRYWGVSDKRRRTGFETLRQISPDKYHFSGGVMSGHYLSSTMEAEIIRQSS